jgi:murein DD-endopeptidase MepM/ murein hydrolase activator NlpD
VIAAARSGSTVDDTIQSQISARSANGTDPQIDPNTGVLSGGPMTKPITIPSIVERGGKYNLNLTSPDEVALIGDQVGQKLIGRNLTDTEKKSVTDAIHSQETTKFNADVNSAEGQRQEQYQARVDARNEQFAGSMPGSSNGGSTVGLGLVAPFANFNLGNSYQHDDQGVDMQTAVNTPVLAAASGHIEIHHDPNGFGPDYAVLMLDTPIKGNTGIYYGHVAPDVADGTHVDAGQQIAHTQPGGPQAGNATQDGWLEMGFWGPKGPTGDGAAMHEILGSAGTGSPTSGPQPSGGVAAGGSIKDFATAVLTQLGITPTAENVKAIAAWQRAEGGSAAFNPLNTTQDAQGATAVNSVGVKNYTSFDQGVQATVQTLQNGSYQPILNALKSGDANAVAAAVGSSPWGTSGDLMKQVLAGGVDVNAVPPNLAAGQSTGTQGATGTVGTDQYIPASVTSTVNPDSPQAASEAYVKQNDQPEYKAHQLVSAYDTFQQIMQAKASDSGAARPVNKI